MGGSMSEPGTLVDLNEDLHFYKNNTSELHKLGWSFENKPIDKLVTGALHVDDSVVLSKIYCMDCLAKGIKAMWPLDVGMSIEEKRTEHEIPELFFVCT